MIDTVALALITAVSGSTGKALSEALLQYVRNSQREKNVKIKLPDGSEFDPNSNFTPKDLYVALKAVEDSVGVVEASNRSDEFIEGVRRTIASQRNERRLQAKLSFFAALTFSIIGAIIIIVGVVLMLSGDAFVGGTITTASGIVSGVASGIFFKFNSETNNRLDTDMNDAQKLEKAQFALDMADKIKNPDERDAAIREAMKTLQAFCFLAQPAIPQLTCRQKQQTEESPHARRLSSRYESPLHYFPMPQAVAIWAQYADHISRRLKALLTLTISAPSG